MALTYSPLTTTFTPPSSCSNEWTILTSTPLTLVNYLSGLDLYLVETCFPPDATTNDLVYSPGLVCPSGWETVSSQETVLIANRLTQNYCCPR